MQPAPHFVNSLGLKMIRVGAAAFDAWTPSFADAETVAVEVSGGLERPPLPHRVELPGDFCLAQVPVTNALYRRFVAETGHRTPGGELFDIDRVKTGKGFSGVILVSEGVETWERDGFTADDQPVAGVNHVDAVAFCAWLSAAEGRTYRLPEAYEWEYACRAGTETLFWWGDRPDPRFMNYAVSRIGHPTPVGFYPPNPWGFHDLHGNVAECCEQIGRPGGVQKGAAWNYPATLTGADIYVDVRGTFAPHMPITRRTLEIGFRICCDAGQAPAPGGAEGRPIALAGGTGPDPARAGDHARREAGLRHHRQPDPLVSGDAVRPLADERPALGRPWRHLGAVHDAGLQRPAAPRRHHHPVHGPLAPAPRAGTSKACQAASAR